MRSYSLKLLFALLGRATLRSLNCEAATPGERSHSGCGVVRRWGNQDWANVLDTSKISDPLNDKANVSRREDHKLTENRKFRPPSRGAASCHRSVWPRSGWNTLKKSGNTEMRNTLQTEGDFDRCFFSVCCLQSPLGERTVNLYGKLTENDW